jgi:hypothetical protein
MLANHDLRAQAAFPFDAPSPLWDGSDWGFEMTIAIATVTIPEDVIVCVSDRMISFGDDFQAEDNALLKANRLDGHWELVWAASDINLVPPIIAKFRQIMPDDGSRKSGEAVAQAMAKVYSDVFKATFVARHLSRFGYKTFEQFRTQGRDELGDHFTELCVQLSRFSLGVEFIIYGHDLKHGARIFEIRDPGEVVDQNLLKFAVIGSGHNMALASLRSRYTQRTFVSESVYDLLCAKFSAETARGVGKTTTVLLLNREGTIRLLPRTEIDQIRAIWDDARKKNAHPPEAIDLIAKSVAIKDVAGEQ